MTNEEKQDLQIVLRLDTIYGLLSFWERMRVRAYMQEWDWGELPEKAEKLLYFVRDTGYVPPSLLVKEDRLTYVDGVLIEEYIKQTSDLDKYLKLLVNKN